MTAKDKPLILIVSTGVLLLLVLIFFRFCGVDAAKNGSYAKKEVDSLRRVHEIAKTEYEDSLNFVRGQLELQGAANLAHAERVADLEKEIDSIIRKHDKTKKKTPPIKWDSNKVVDYTTYAMLVPNEYVDECELCYATLKTYKEENAQIRFERDSYDTLMRQQISIQDNRVAQLENERAQFARLLMQQTPDKCDTTRKVKFSLMGMANNYFLPRAGGFGLIYEDKKFNEYGAHVLFSNTGNIYIINAAKTISFRRKR